MQFSNVLSALQTFSMLSFVFKLDTMVTRWFVQLQLSQSHNSVYDRKRGKEAKGTSFEAL